MEAVLLITYAHQVTSLSSDREVLCSGCHVDLCRPLPKDYSFLIQLRNHAHIRKQFCDTRVIDPAKGYEWLASHAGRMDDTLLLIRHRLIDQHIGSIGWSDYNPETRSAEFGRLAIDPSLRRTLARHNKSHSIVLRGLALDACLTLRDYVFSTLDFQEIRTCYKQGNLLAAKVNQGIGMIVTPTQNSQNNDDLIRLTLSRQEWVSLKRKQR